MNKYLLVLPLSVYLYICMVATFRDLQFLFGIGSSDYREWKVRMFEYPDFVLIDWWYLFIPSFIFSYLLTYLNWKYQLAIYLFIGLLTGYLVLT